MYTTCFPSLECHKRATGSAGTVACPDTESQDSLSSPKSWLHSTPQHKRNCLCCKQAWKSILVTVHLDKRFMIRMSMLGFYCWSTQCRFNTWYVLLLTPGLQNSTYYSVICFSGVSLRHINMSCSLSPSPINKSVLCSKYPRTQQLVDHQWSHKVESSKCWWSLKILLSTFRQWASH